MNPITSVNVSLSLELYTTCNILLPCWGILVLVVKGSIFPIRNVRKDKTICFACGYNVIGKGCRYCICYQVK